MCIAVFVHLAFPSEVVRHGSVECTLPGRLLLPVWTVRHRVTTREIPAGRLNVAVLGCVRQGLGVGPSALVLEARVTGLQTITGLASAIVALRWLRLESAIANHTTVGCHTRRLLAEFCGGTRTL